jgi:hypothetical protein
MSRFTIGLTVALLSFALAGASRGEDAWQMPSLNPFAKKKAGPPTSARVSDSSSGWKMPSLWPAKKPATAAARKPAQPTAWQRMSNSTRQFWSTTADTLNPFNDAADKPQQPISATGANSAFTQAANRKSTAAKSKTFLPSWMSSGDDESAAREETPTVNSFLSRPRPGL